MASVIGQTFWKKFPGYGKDLWEGRVEAEIAPGKFEVYYAKDKSTMVMTSAALSKLIDGGPPSKTGASASSTAGPKTGPKAPRNKKKTAKAKAKAKTKADAETKAEAKEPTCVKAESKKRKVQADPQQAAPSAPSAPSASSAPRDQAGYEDEDDDEDADDYDDADDDAPLYPRGSSMPARKAPTASGGAAGGKAKRKAKMGGNDGASRSHWLADQVFRFSVYDITEFTGRQHELRDDLEILVDPRSSTLYEVIALVFDSSIKGDAIYSHIWTVRFAGQGYGGPFDGCAGEAMGSSSKPCTEECPVPLDSDSIGGMAPALGGHRRRALVGARGSFKMESVTFKLKLLDIEPADASVSYPRVTRICAAAVAGQGMSVAKAADHLAAGEQAAALQFRAEYEQAAAGNNTWVRERTPQGSAYVAGPHKPPAWNSHMGDSGHPLFQAHNLMGMLLQARWGFAAAWKHILQYCILDRSKAATATKFGTMKKNDYEWDNIGRGMSQDQQVVAAKKLGRTIMRAVMQGGVPTLGRKPKTEMEKLMSGNFSSSEEGDDY